MIFSCPICDEMFVRDEDLKRHVCQDEPFETVGHSLVLEARGRTPLFDVARLDEEHLVVAMGQAGIGLVGSEGTILERIPAVCFRLVQGQGEVLLWGPEEVLRLDRAGLKLWFRGKPDKAARHTGAGFWPVVVDRELQLIGLDSETGAACLRRRTFPMVLDLCLQAERLSWWGKALDGPSWYEVLDYPQLVPVRTQTFEWKEHSWPVMAPDRIVWLRSDSTGHYHTVDSTLIAPVVLSHDHRPRVDGHYLVISARHGLSSLLTVVDLDQPGRQLQIVLPGTYYRDLQGQARVQWRIQGECLCLADSRGCLAAVRLDDGAVRFTHVL